MLPDLVKLVTRQTNPQNAFFAEANKGIMHAYRLQHKLEYLENRYSVTHIRYFFESMAATYQNSAIHQCKFI